MKIYLASRYSRFPEMQGHRLALEARGHVVTSRWIEGKHELARDQSGNPISGLAADEARRRFAIEDYGDLVEAHCVISFTEDPHARIGGRGGRHVEFGIAVSLGKRLIVIGHRENVFHWIPGVEFFSTWAEALTQLEKELAEGDEPPRR